MAGVLELRAACSSTTHVAEVDVGGWSGRSRASPAAGVARRELLGEPPLGQRLDGPFQEAARRRLATCGFIGGPNARLTRSLGGLLPRHFPSVIFDGRTRFRPVCPPGRPLTCSESNRECMARFRFPGRSSDGASSSDNGSNDDGTVSKIAPKPDDSPTKPRRPRLRKLRIALVFFGLAVLALVSWIFGIMMAVASDLPQLDNRAQFKNAQNSVVYDINGEQDRDPDQQPGPDPAPLRGHRPGDEGGDGGDRGPALLRAPRRRLPGHRPRGGPGRASARAPPRAPRRSPSSSSRTRFAPRAAAPSSRSSARRRSPTSSSATGTRTRSSPST